MNSKTEDKRKTPLFDSFSVYWWGTGSLIRGLQQAHELILPYIRHAFQKHGYVKEEGGKFSVPEERHLLDVGCGGGFLTETLSEMGFNVVGIDINQNMIKVAKDHAQLNSSLTRLSYLWETIETHAQEHPEKYDIVVSTFVLQHIINHEILLRKAIETLKPGGLLYLTSAAKTFTSWIRINILGIYVYRYVAKNSHNWNNFISAKEVTEILYKNNCTVIETTGMYYDIFTSSWNWWNNVDGGFYSILAVKNN
ncbi:hypothetical protein FQA39_LY16145 [Lamprigera yunnana]|nr:hypothetical protein FQA39_LY16145 [Lamprigera yunnana]